ncbi:unnamed protein product [Oikopleura dioica]|uniref:TauD/TfdA-like domain-containing protein n=1 Tax=Oikopleura dioica TaxID=34765 RepID=E4XW09_OIKDI|nr:unnamed protein product [Oikopleura dioica]
MLKIFRSGVVRRSVRVEAFSECTAKLQLEMNDKLEKVDFSALWLRFNCHCPECRQQGSGQKTLSPLVWPEDIKLQEAFFENDELKFSIKGEDHEGVIPGQVLRKFVSDERARRSAAAKMCYLRKPKQGWGSEIDFSQTNNQKGQYDMTQKIAKNGFCVAKNCPTKKNGVLDVCHKISEPIPFLYGLVQNIVNEPNPTNIAFSDAFLAPHMDMVYMESPPGLQYLLCRRNDDCVEGGESILIDAFEVAEHLRANHPRDFETLCSVPVRFQKIHWERENPVYFEWEQPHIVLDNKGQISRVNWAPAFEGKSRRSSMTNEYIQAYRRFMKQVDESDTKIVKRLNEGECIVFNNRRMLHGRTGFKLNGGVRFMEVAYTNICEFRSKAQVLEFTHGQGEIVTRVGNSNLI